MAYNRQNHLRRIIEVQELALTAKRSGVPFARLYRDTIRPRFFISRSTFYNYLTTNARRELREIGAPTHARVSGSKSRI